MADLSPSFSQPMPCGYAWVNCDMSADLFLTACADLWRSYNGRDMEHSEVSDFVSCLFNDARLEVSEDG